MDERREEVASKLALLRNRLGSSGAVRLRGLDWFSWATAGASNALLLAQETGVAEVLVTPSEAWILTDEIEAQRLREEELPDNFQLFQGRWAAPEEREEFVRDTIGGCQVWSDRPNSEEKPLFADLLQYKRILTPSEVTRYRRVGQLAAEAMTEVLGAAQPGWTELELAGAGAQALMRRGLDPASIMAAGSERLARYRHPKPTTAILKKGAMLGFCARGFGLYANLTRFVSFGPLDEDTRRRHNQESEIEAEALQCCIPGTRLDQIYAVLQDAYQRRGFSEAITQHHQGGLTGYLAREIVATPLTGHILNKCEAVAWNPSLPGGAKIEDTFLIKGNGGPNLENLTLSSDWPSQEIGGLHLPLVWER